MFCRFSTKTGTNETISKTASSNGQKHREAIREGERMNKYEKDQLLEQVMVEYGNELVRLAFTYVKNSETAKDMVQNAFIKCYENLDDFRFDASLKTWLYRITINQCKDYLKSWHHKKVQAKHFIQDTAQNILPSAEHKVLAKSEQQEMKDFIFALPANDREVLYLHYYQSLKLEEIAEMTGVGLNTVKTRLRRAKQKLKRKLEEAAVYG